MNPKTKHKFNIIVIIIIILFSIGTIPKSFQEDTFYMIKVGEYVFNNGMQVIENRIEPFTWHTEMTYTYPHWLLDVVFYLIYLTYNFRGIYILTVILGVIIYLLIYYANVRIGKNNIISAVLTIASIYILRDYITARAQVITYICLILEILLIEIFLEKGKKRYLIGLIFIPILLANCHAALFPIYFVVYLPYILEYMISILDRKHFYEKRKKKIQRKLSKLLNKNSSREKKLVNKIDKINAKLVKMENISKDANKKIVIEKNKNAKWLILTFVVCIFTGLLTPLKDIPYTYMIKSIQGNTMNWIAEHTAVTLITSPIILGTIFLIVALLFSNKIKIKLRDIIMLAGMSILLLISYKQFPIFIICTICIINKLFYIIINDDRKEKARKIVSKALKIKGIIYIILIIIILFLIQYKDIERQSYVNGNDYPIQATQWIKDNFNLQGIRLFNDFNYGSYLLFNDVPVFIDGRADVYDPVFNGKEDDIFLDFMHTTSLQIWYEDTFKKYDITHIMTKTNSNLNLYLQRNINYKNIYNDGIFSIYENSTN